MHPFCPKTWTPIGTTAQLHCANIHNTHTHQQHIHAWRVYSNKAGKPPGQRRCRWCERELQEHAGWCPCELELEVHEVNGRSSGARVGFREAVGFYYFFVSYFLLYNS